MNVRQVSSSTERTGATSRRPRSVSRSSHPSLSRLSRVVGAACLAFGLWAGPATSAGAEDLFERHAQLQSSIAAARGQVDTHSAAVASATDALEASQQQLAEAQAELERIRGELDEARAADAEIAANLARQQKLLDAARAALAKAQANVEAQRVLIVGAARDAFQNRSDLSGVVVVLGARSYSDLQQRVQWDTTIFDATAYRMAELKELEARVAEAERKQAAIEAAVAEEKRRSEESLARIAKLEASAKKTERDVQALVARNDEFRAAAQAALDDDTREYEALLATEAEIEGQIAAQVSQQLSGGASREDIARLVEMGIVSRDPSTYPLVADGPQGVLSPQGFIRPVKARPGSPFGQRFHPILKYWRMHNGTDFGAACGTPLYAAQSGRVIQAGRNGGFGNYVIIDHGVIGGVSIMTGYAHQSAISVHVGQQVSMGQQIGLVGTTGLSTGCHLHLQVYRNGKPVNPMEYIP